MRIRAVQVHAQLKAFYDWIGALYPFTELISEIWTLLRANESLINNYTGTTGIHKLFWARCMVTLVTNS